MAFFGICKRKRFLSFEGVDVQKIDVNSVKMCCDYFSESNLQINCQEMRGSLAKEQNWCRKAFWFVLTKKLFCFDEEIAIAIDEDVLGDKFVEENGC